MKVTLKGKEYEVRHLEFDDTFRLAEILDKIDFDVAKFQTDLASLNLTGDSEVPTDDFEDDEEEDNENEELPESQEQNSSIEKAGMIVFAKMATHVLKNSYKAKKEFRAFFAGLINVKPEQMGHMPINAPFIILKALAEEHDLLDFFKQAAG